MLPQRYHCRKNVQAQCTAVTLQKLDGISYQHIHLHSTYRQVSVPDLFHLFAEIQVQRVYFSDLRTDVMSLFLHSHSVPDLVTFDLLVHFYAE